MSTERIGGKDLRSQFGPQVHGELTAAMSVFAGLVDKEHKGEQVTAQEVASGVVEGKTVEGIVNGDPATSQEQFDSILAVLPQDDATRLQDLVDKSGGFVPFAKAALSRVTDGPPQAEKHSGRVQPDMFGVRFYTCAVMVGAILAGQEEFIPAYIGYCAGDWMN
jgi:hypothetical protein